MILYFFLISRKDSCGSGGVIYPDFTIIKKLIIMKRDLIKVLMSSLLVYSILTIFKCLTIIYFIITDEYFLKAEFNNDEVVEKSQAFLLYTKLIPIISFLILANWIKKYANLRWTQFIIGSIFALIIFRFFDIKIVEIFIITDNHIKNTLFAILFNVVIIYCVLKGIKKLNLQ